MQQLHALNPELELLEPEDPKFADFLAEVTAIDPRLANQIDKAVLDEQAEEARELFGKGAQQGGVMTVLNRTNDRFKGTSVRGEKRMRPATLAAYAGAGILGLVLVTALMPEKKTTTTTTTTTETPDPQQDGKTEAVAQRPEPETPLPTSTVDDAPLDTTATDTASSEPAPAPVTVEEAPPTAPLPEPEPVPEYVPPADPTPTYVPPSDPAPAYVPSSDPAPVARTEPVVTPLPAPRPVTLSTPSTLEPAPKPVVVEPPTPAPVKTLPAPKPIALPEPRLVSPPAPQTPPKAFTSAPAQPSAAPRRGLVSGTPEADAAQAQAARPARGVVASTPDAQSNAPTRGMVSSQPAQTQAAETTPPQRGLVASSAPQEQVAVRRGLVSGNGEGGETSAGAQQTVSGMAAADTAPRSAAGLVSASATEPQTPVRGFVSTDTQGNGQTALASQGNGAFVDGSSNVQAQSGQTGAPTSPYTPGMQLALTLDHGVAAYPGSSHPVWAKAVDGSIWRGEATLNAAANRILLTFDSVMVQGKAFPVTAYAESPDGVGIGGRIRPSAPDAARAAVNGLLGGIKTFAESQAARTTTYSSSGLVTQSERPQNFWLAVGGSIASAFTVPQTQASVVPLGQMRAGEALTIRVDLARGGTP